MKICILTQPLRTNYGGLLQAYALQKVLKDMGHEVFTENRKANKGSILSRVKQLSFVRKLFGKPFLSEKDWATISQHTSRFIQKNIQTTCVISDNDKSKLEQYNFEAYVVGSDQVWRPCYSPSIYNYFLDFAQKKSVKRIAYAASFGVDEWEFTLEQTLKCKTLIKKFDAISVRENSAVNLCKQKFDVDAVHVLDPTMLLTKNDYISLIGITDNKERKQNIMAYVLDKSVEKMKIVDKISSRFHLNANFVMPKKELEDIKSGDICDYIFPSVGEWIKGFVDAEFVVTDSFHGTVFAIIFNKPFISIANEGRGLSRFTSLLNIFGLSNRLVFSVDQINEELLTSAIDYEKVNFLLQQQKEKSFLFLTKILS